MDSDSEMEEPGGVYWTPVTEVGAADVHPDLLAAVGPTSTLFFSAEVYDIPSAAPLGAFEIAVDAHGRACGVYRAVFLTNEGADDRSTVPAWLATADPDAAMDLLYEKLKSAGVLP